MTRKELDTIVHEVAIITLETPHYYAEGGDGSKLSHVVLERKLQEYIEDKVQEENKLWEII
jgi:hypothetical protein